MAQKKFGELPAASAVEDGDLIPARQSKSGGGYETRGVTGAMLKAYARAGLGTAAYSDASDFASAGQGQRADTAIQPGDLGSAAQRDVGDFASAAQGAKADSAVQPNVLGSLAAKDKVAVGDLDATGTPSASTYLRGDGSWATPPSGGSGGSVDSVNGQVGTVNLTASDVGARPAGDVPWSDVSDKPAVIGAGATAAAARAAIGAGVSDLAIGNTGTTAKAGNWMPGWSDVSGKPSTFPPAAHAHPISDVTGLQAALDGKAPAAHSHTWASITDKPASIAAGATPADARAAVGAGTSDLTIGTTASTAKAGDWMPAWGDITGKPAIIAAGATKADARNAVDAIALADVAAYTAPVKPVTRAQYDALDPPVPGTVYVVVD